MTADDNWDKEGQKEVLHHVSWREKMEILNQVKEKKEKLEGPNLLTSSRIQF